MDVNSSSVSTKIKVDVNLLECMEDVEMDMKDDFIVRPATPPNNVSPGVFLNKSPMFDQLTHSPLNKGINQLIINSPIPFKRLDFCNYTTPSPSDICRKRNISTCPPIRNRFRQTGGLRCYSTEHLKPKGVKAALMEYINPFTPDGRIIALKKAQRSSLADSSIRKFILNDSIESEELNISDVCLKRSRLNELNVERYNKEFVELEEIGKGVYGSVYKCLNRMNGCIYAVKKTNNEVVNTSSEQIVRNEVYAHGILDHPNLVKNYSSWTESGYVFFQNEYCNGGSLTDFTKNHVFLETEARTLLYQIGLGLCYLHKKGFAHMDIKPDNIFLHENGKNENLLNNNLAAAATSKSNEGTKELIYKLGDFGHVVPLDGLSVEDGDCRYLSKEIIQDNYAHLDKADIFSLGLTIYEIISRQPLPKNGDEWQRIREEGYLKYLEQYSAELNDLLKEMVKSDPVARPSAGTICEQLNQLTKSPKHDQDLFGYLQQINNNVNILQHKVDYSGRYSKIVCRFISDKWGTSLKRPSAKGRLLVGKKQQRSNSTTTF